MVRDLGLTEYAYGLGASLFFIGYFIFEVPSNVILERVGARLWFARIMVSWGIVTLRLPTPSRRRCSTSSVFCSGACEAGFFPGVLYLLTLGIRSPTARGWLAVHVLQRDRQCDRRADWGAF